MKREISYNFYLFFIQIGKADKALDLDIRRLALDLDIRRLAELSHLRQGQFNKFWRQVRSKRFTAQLH